MKKKELGELYFDMATITRQTKEMLNEQKIYLGLFLDQLQKIHKDLDEKGDDSLGTFRQLLATMHLNMGRAIPLIRNARYVEKCNIDLEDYKYLDSSVINKCRLKNKTPNLDDIKGGVSFNDLTD